jgi:hypothetical protein
LVYFLLNFNFHVTIARNFFIEGQSCLVSLNAAAAVAVVVAVVVVGAVVARML